jgi:6-phosphogluconolactonase (cycloisomerase 2 family)
MAGNKITGLSTAAPTDNSDATSKAYVDSKATVQSVNTKTGDVVLSAGDIAITDNGNNFATDTVQGAIDQLFQSANSGKTAIAGAIGSPATSSDTFSQLASAITTGKGQIATAIGGMSVSSSSTFTELATAISAGSSTTLGVEKSVFYDETIAKNDIVESYYKSQSLTRLTQPSVLPEGESNFVAWSPDGKLFAVAHGSGSFLSIFNYNESTNTFTNFTDPITLPPSTAFGIDFSNNGDYLAVAHASTGQCSIYKKSGSSFIKLPALPSNPGGSTGRCVAFSPDSNYLSLGQSGGFAVYFRSGEAFTRLTSVPADLTSQGSTVGTAWSPDSRYTISGYSTSPFIKILRRDGDGTTASLTRVASTESLDGAANAAAWSYDGQYLAIAYSGGSNVTFGSNRIAIFKQSGDTFIRLNINGQPAMTAGGTGVVWSKDGRYIYLTNGSAPLLSVIKRTGDSFVFSTNPTTPFGNPCNTVAVHPNNNIISVGHNLNNFLTHYRNDGVYLFTKANTDVIDPLDKIIGIAKQAGNAGDQRTVDVLVGRSLLP